MANTKLDTTLPPRIRAIIARLGTTITFYYGGLGEYDHQTGDTIIAGKSAVDQKCTPPTPYSRRYIDGDLIQEGDMLTFVANDTLEFTPINGMRAELNSVSWFVVSVQAIYSGELVAAWELQLRRVN